MLVKNSSASGPRANSSGTILIPCWADLTCGRFQASTRATDFLQRFSKSDDESLRPFRVRVYFTTKLMAEPAKTLDPATGSWATMIDAGEAAAAGGLASLPDVVIPGVAESSGATVTF